jgi:hypothetical protein
MLGKEINSVASEASYDQQGLTISCPSWIRLQSLPHSRLCCSATVSLICHMRFDVAGYHDHLERHAMPRHMQQALLSPPKPFNATCLIGTSSRRGLEERRNKILTVAHIGPLQHPQNAEVMSRRSRHSDTLGICGCSSRKKVESIGSPGPTPQRRAERFITTLLILGLSFAKACLQACI